MTQSSASGSRARRSRPEDDLRGLVHLLRKELEWAARAGIEITAPKPVSEAVVESEPDGPALSVEAGRPAPPQEESAESSDEASEDEPPPAFAPDSDEESIEPEISPVSPVEARVRSAAADRPWEQYIGQEGEAPPATGSGRDSLALAEASTLPEVRSILGDCTRCKLHQAGRRQIVFGVGNPNAQLMFIGEGPGRQEDQQGEPFVGDAGQLLTRIIENGMKLRRSDVYIANIIKCRPPNNRDPESDEVEACEKFLKAQVRLVNPQVIIALGKYAAQTLLRSKTPISRLRGRWQSYEGIDLMPTFHPAYLLRNPEGKRPVWEDVQQVMKRLEGGSR